MSGAEWALVVAAVVAVVLWAVWVEASRIDRLHRKVAASRATLETQLVRRATVAVELASSGVLDPVSSVLVGEAAFAALDASSTGPGEMTPVPADLARLVGADGPGAPARDERPPTAGRVRGPGSGSGDGDPAGPAARRRESVAGPAPAGPGDRPVHPGATQPPLADVDRGLAESELSATLRAALEDADEVAAVRAEPGGAELVEALAAAWFRVQLARRFHNEAVAQTRRVRQKAVVRWLRLAGHAPLPHPLDLDDAWPPALGRPGASTSRREV